MKAGIITVPNSRNKELTRLVYQIENAGVPVKVFYDPDRLGAFWNYMRMLKEMVGGAEKDEKILLLTDDVITIPGWKKYFERIHERVKDSIYCLYSRKKSIFTKKNLEIGSFTGIQKRGFYDPATVYINQQDLYGAILSWFKSEGRYLINAHRQRHHDVVIQEYLVHNKIPWTTTTPTIFQHIGYKSVIGHSHYDGGSPAMVTKDMM